MRLTVAKGMWTAARQRPDIDTQGLDTDDWLYLADAALTALGLDDFDAAALRALDAYDDTSVALDNQDAFRVALEAALTATENG